mmetsp:Transcript_68684/g.223581  ORF Transcript_68684/g.223581 Transcript_68684/m.223581 type:complete len:324 (+) Transcript_68684:428-1399(+)
MRLRGQHLDVVPPTRRKVEHISRSKNNLQALALEIRKLWKGLQVGSIEIDPTLPILWVVHRPRIQTCQVPRVEEQDPLVPPNLPEQIVLRVVMARREVPFLAAEKLAGLHMAAAHLLPQPIPAEFLNVFCHLHCATDPETPDWSGRTFLLFVSVQERTLQVHRVHLLASSLLLSGFRGLFPEGRKSHFNPLVGPGHLVATRVLLRPHVVVREAPSTGGRRSENEEVVDIADVALQILEVPQAWGPSEHATAAHDDGHRTPEQRWQLRIRPVDPQHLAACQRRIVPPRSTRQRRDVHWLLRGPPPEGCTGRGDEATVCVRQLSK